MNLKNNQVRQASQILLLIFTDKETEAQDDLSRGLEPFSKKQGLEASIFFDPYSVTPTTEHKCELEYLSLLPPILPTLVEGVRTLLTFAEKKMTCKPGKQI